MANSIVEISSRQIVAEAVLPAWYFAGSVVCLTVVAIYLVFTWRKRCKARLSSTNAEQEFRNVFAIMSEGRRQSLISHYMTKHQCGRGDAMRIAVEDQRQDNSRW